MADQVYYSRNLPLAKAQAGDFTVVDATEEARRLRQNAAAGLPPTTGDTPQIKRGTPALLEGVF